MCVQSVIVLLVFSDFAELLRVEEALRRCWNKKTYTSGSDARQSKPVPLGMDDEYTFLGPRADV